MVDDISLSDLRNRFKKLHWSSKPECPDCGKPFVNPIDFHTGLPNCHLWKPSCFCMYDRNWVLSLG